MKLPSPRLDAAVSAVSLSTSPAAMGRGANVEKMSEPFLSRKLTHDKEALTHVRR